MPANPLNDPQFSYQSGLEFFRQGKLAEAAVAFQRAIDLQPHNVTAHYNLGLALHRTGKLEHAIASYRQALLLDPNLHLARNNLGAALKSLGRLDEAISSFRQVLVMKPDAAEVHANLGNALAVQGKLDDAVASYRQALRLRPDSAETYYNLGFALGKHGRAEEACAALREALRLKPDHVEANYQMAIARHEQANMDEAVTWYDRTLQLAPDHAGAHFNRAVLLLARGQWARAWPEFEWRWKLNDLPPYGLDRPRWDGGTLQGRAILIHAEQGLGDTIHFIRFLPLVKARGATVIFECQPELLPLLTGFPGIDHLIGRGSTRPAFDVYAPLLSVPGILRTTLADIPASIPYLYPVQALVHHWRRELGRLSGFKVGIAWQGNKMKPDDIYRSIPLARFAGLARLPGVQLVSLQKGPGREQLKLFPGGSTITDLSGRFDETCGAFLDTAALMMNLDLVISSDTAVPHLAGALAVPVWVALPLVPDWRWLLERANCPWYPSMRLFRQVRHGDWDSVFDRMAEELKTR